MTEAASTPPRGRADIDLEAIARLVEELERDLQKVRQGTQDVQTLRAEVQALSDVLEYSAPPHAQIGHRLGNIHSLITNAREIAREDAFKTADYAARIGRMLGM